jgi:transposase
MGRACRYSPEVRKRAVRMLFDTEEDYDSQWAAIRVVAEQIGCSTVARHERGVSRQGGVRDRVRSLARPRAALAYDRSRRAGGLG